MKEIFFLAGQYMPKASANGICTHAIAKALVDDGEKVTVICNEDGFSMDTYEGVAIRRIPVPLYIKNANKRGIASIIRRMDSIIRKLIYLHHYPLRSNALVNEYAKAVISEVERKSTDQIIVVSVVNPLEAAIAGAKLKKIYGSKCRAIYYCADTLSNEMGNEALLSNSYISRMGFKWEKKLFSIFDKIMIMEPQKEHYYSEQYGEFKHKMVLANFPLLKRDNNAATTSNNEKCLLVYAGTIYKNLRNPTYLLGLLSGLTAVCDCEIVFLGGCDCKELFDKAEADSKGRIKYIGMQPYDVAQEYLRKANVLLSIGNKESHMAPSKIYEYMSSGKPIIHTYTDDDDMCVPTLNQYGNALIIREDSMKSNTVEQVKDFILNSNLVEYEVIRERFLLATPEYSAGIIMEKA